MPDDPRRTYLAGLDELLPMQPERRAEVIEEISAHLDDAVTDGIERGMSKHDAEAAAQQRLGTPDKLARELARPYQSARRLLTATGAGVLSGIRHGLLGYFIGGLALYLAFTILVALTHFVGSTLELNLTVDAADRGWNTFLGSGAIGIGLYLAGRAMPETISRNGHRMVSDVRPWVAGVVTAVAFWLTVFVIEVPHNWASVAAWTLVPLAFAFGAYRPGLLPRWRVPLAWIVVAILLVPMLGVALAGGGEGASDPAATEMPFDDATVHVGARWEEGLGVGGSLFASSGMPIGPDDGARFEWELADGARLTGVTGIRAEAWHSDPDAPWRIDATFEAPFSVAPVERNGLTLAAELDVTDHPGVSYWELILTGVGPDGHRYVLDSGMVNVSTFSGTVLDWVVAVTD
jgi:uncharacterized membrane protein